MLIACENITMGYEGKTVAENISFSVNEGEFICIVGENGCGKTTLIKGILGILPIKSGKVSFSGMSKRDMGYLPQQTTVQRDFPASVYEVVLSGFLNRKRFFSFYTKTDKTQADNNLKRFSIYDLKKNCYRELSGGQQQRVLLCRAFCAAKKVIILDEPVTGLDTIALRELYAVLKDMCLNNMAVIMVTHSIGGALENADKILHMDDKAFFFGPANEYKKSRFFNKLTGEII